MAFRMGVLRQTFVVMALMLVSSASAQLDLSSSALRKAGLELMWSSQVQVDRRYGSLGEITLHVNPVSQVSIMEVHHDQGVTRFSELQFPGADGRAAAKRMADIEVIRREALGQHPKLEERLVPRTRIFCQTSNGVLQCINAETGGTEWSVSVGRSTSPGMAAASNGTIVAAVNGANLSLLDYNTGKLLREERLVSTPAVGPLDATLGPGMSVDWVFVPTINGLMEGFHLTDTSRPPWRYVSGGEITGRPTVGSHTVSWTTENGDMIVANANSPVVMYRFELGGSIEAFPALTNANRLVVASTSGYAFALDDIRGSTQWEFAAGDEIVHPPVSIEKDVYLITAGRDLYCVNEEDGMERWVCRGVERFLAASKTRIYALSRFNELLVLDRTNGGRLARVNIGKADLQYVNQSTDRIILATRSGELVSLRERSASWPTIFANLQQPESREPLVRKERDTTADQPTETPEEQPEDNLDQGDDFGFPMDDAPL
ncbi:MAG: PQQ-binding-like beta-propeller repeat protein, partial [Planctomycetales bacterium]|nr:PQQ-binding-like beta-propeller repeat protein [Planctomycetales bacterium]